MKEMLVAPAFESEDAERDFWAEINLADYYEPADALSVMFPNLKPSPQQVRDVLSAEHSMKALLDGLHG